MRDAPPVWVPYVEVRGIKEVTDRARSLGATVLLEPRECADGWCSVVTSVQGGEIALWQPRPAIDRPPPPAGNDGTHR